MLSEASRKAIDRLVRLEHIAVSNEQGEYLEGSRAYESCATELAILELALDELAALPQMPVPVDAIENAMLCAQNAFGEYPEPRWLDELRAWLATLDAQEE